jgi:hypothetical protein
MDEIMGSDEKQEWTRSPVVSLGPANDGNNTCLPFTEQYLNSHEVEDPQEDLLTSYINSSEGLHVDNEQEFSLGSCVGASFSFGLNSSPARESNKDIFHSEELVNVDRHHGYSPSCNVYVHSTILDMDENATRVHVSSKRDASYGNMNLDMDEENDYLDNGPNSHKDVLRDHVYDHETTLGHINGVIVDTDGMNDKQSEKSSVDPAPSSAMKVAQELLRKNRLKRQSHAVKSDLTHTKSDPHTIPEPDETPFSQDEVLSNDGYDQADSQSELSRSDKNARRALILQLAKSRINKNQKIPVMVSMD